MIYVSGDAMIRDKSGRRRVVASYEDQTPARIDEDVRVWASGASTPAINIARPGLYGSSGDHNIRRSFRELTIVNTALTQLKTKYRIEKFVLVGHSGGGQIAAGLMAMRSDLAGVVISSGLLSVRQVTSSWEFKRDVPGRYLYDAEGYYDPLEMIGEIEKGNSAPVYIISDPEDTAVPFYSQLRYVRKRRTAGISVQHIFSHGPGPAHHLLGEQAKIVAAMFVNGHNAMGIRADLQAANIEVVGKGVVIKSRVPSRVTLPPLLTAKSAICTVIRRDGYQCMEALFSKNADMPMPPASLIKILIAMVALDFAEEKGVGLDHEIEIIPEDVAKGSGGNIFSGERISFADGLINLLLPSSNTIANAFCRHFGGLLMDGESDADAFLSGINRKLESIGASATRIENPSGLASKNQETTARDLAKIFMAALNYPEITRVWGLSDARIQIRGQTVREIDVASTVGIVKDYDFIGGKTGTLVPGVFNIAAITASPDGTMMVSVILGCQSDADRISELRRMVDYVKRRRVWG